MENKEKIIKVLKENKQPLKPGDIAELTKLDKKEVDKGIKELKKDDRIFSPKRCFYAAK